MARGPGMTGDGNFAVSCEYFKKGDATRTIAYGKTRDEVLATLQAAHGTQEEWQWDWIVTERRCAMGLPPAWMRATRGYKAYLRPN